MPFVHLERDLWDLRDAAGQEIGPDAPERRAWLLDRGAAGRLRAPVERLLADPKTLAAAARLLLDLHLTPVLAELICAAVDLDVPALDASGGAAQPARLRPRRRGFAEEVLRAYAYQCAMCGFDGALGRYPVGIEAAHVRWHSQQGPDELANALALCALHHALFDLGVPGITRRPPHPRIQPVRRQERGWHGRRRPRRQAPADSPPAPAIGGHNPHFLAPPPGI